MSTLMWCASAACSTSGTPVRQALPNGRSPPYPVDGGRTWWAHFEFTRINIEPIILRNKIEDLRQVGTFMFRGHVDPLIR
jgi:hypothetical protein